MQKTSKTWPSIIKKTMAVVQLRFDGKYAYSTIADINLNQPHIIENQISVTSERRSRLVEVQGGEEEEEEDCQDNNNKRESDCICEDKKQLQERCRSMYNRSQNGQLCRSPMNSHSPNSASSSPTIKFCICNFHTNNHHHNINNSKNRHNRSESIKVENWDFIYRERTFLDVSHADRNVAVPKSPQNGFSQLDHGYLSGLGAQKLDTIFRHYYPESGFGWIILIVAILVAIFTHGFQLSAIFFLLPALNRFQADKIDCLGELKFINLFVFMIKTSADISTSLAAGTSFFSLLLPSLSVHLQTFILAVFVCIDAEREGGVNIIKKLLQ